MYFFTVITNQRKPVFTNDYARSCLRKAFDQTRQKWPFTIEAIVLLPNHLHTIWQLPENECDYSTRWRLIKDKFTRCIKQPTHTSYNRSQSRIKKKEQGIWQLRFGEHQIRDEKELENHLNYIHYNPVMHGYVNSPSEWEWSSFQRYVNMGWYDSDWRGGTMIEIMERWTGE